MRYASYYNQIQQLLRGAFPRGSLLKTLVLKLFLHEQEKQFFYLIAPEDSVKTNNPPGYLFRKGWWQTTKTELFTDGIGSPIPWLSYPAIDFITPRLRTDLSLLEYGGGGSTLFWAKQLDQVVTIEHQQEWYTKLRAQLPTHVQLIYQTLDPLTDYLSPSALEGLTFDLIVIDGRQRVACCQSVMEKLKPGGIVILDDSQRQRYADGSAYLLQQGFKALPFWGLRHRASTNTCTTIFYRSGNCLDI